MTLEELSKNLPKDWWKKLERAAFRERVLDKYLDDGNVGDEEITK
jgi:hypothetical protein